MQSLLADDGTDWAVAYPIVAALLRGTSYAALVASKSGAASAAAPRALPGLTPLLMCVRCDTSADADSAGVWLPLTAPSPFHTNFPTNKVGGHIMTSSRFTGQAPSAFTLVNATEQRRALRLIANALTGPSLYLNATDYPLLSQRAYTFGGRRWSDDPGALGRLPAPLLQDARAAKIGVLRNLFVPLRVDAMGRSSWALRGELGGSCAFVVDAEARTPPPLVKEPLSARPPALVRAGLTRSVPVSTLPPARRRRRRCAWACRSASTAAGSPSVTSSPP